MRKYLEAPSLSLDGDPLDWWRSHESAFPTLAKLAKRYLCIPGTSVAAERVFSTAGDIVTAHRSRLSPKHVDQLIFLHKNLYVPGGDDEKGRRRKDHDYYAVDVDDITDSESEGSH